MIRSVVRRNMFDALASSYDTPWKVARSQEVAEIISSRPWFRSGDRLLDVGAGTGLLTFAMEPHFKQLTAFDTSAGMLDVLNKKLADSTSNKLWRQSIESCVCTVFSPSCFVPDFNLNGTDLQPWQVRLDCVSACISSCKGFRGSCK
mmetsp:Transcript_1501/g.3063  ORF Transcript_1501/g.3063 Transcript_1501/m.3063 type:complete len:147 (-) Transcript_1501:544-984(-)